MTDVVVTIHRGAVDLEYRQGTTGDWLPVDGGANAMHVSTATQFRSGGAVYKWTKGSWLNGGYYNVTLNAGTKLTFVGNYSATDVIYNP